MKMSKIIAALLQYLDFFISSALLSVRKYHALFGDTFLP